MHFESSNAAKCTRGDVIRILKNVQEFHSRINRTRHPHDPGPFLHISLLAHIKSHNIISRKLVDSNLLLTISSDAANRPPPPPHSVISKIYLSAALFAKKKIAIVDFTDGAPFSNIPLESFDSTSFSRSRASFTDREPHYYPKAGPIPSQPSCGRGDRKSIHAEGIF